MERVMRAGAGIGPFVLEELVGAGGMGSVWRARHRRSGATVAVKLMTPGGASSVARFVREAETLSRMEHDAIVRYVGHGEAPDGRRYLAMEWLAGEDLAARLSRGPLAVSESVALARRVAEALAVVHAEGVVHRDLKPANLLLVGGDPCAVKLVDFGVARWGRGDRGVTRSGAVVGTAGYMAPEQARGERALDARADVFAFGCVLFECLTGQAAFAGEHYVAVLAKVLFDEAPRAGSLAAVPGALDALIARMLAKDPAARPADGAAVAAALGALGDIAAVGGSGRVAEGVVAAALSAREQRVVSVVVAGAALETLDAVETPLETLRDEAAPWWAAVRSAAEGVGARAEKLADGTVVVVLSGSGLATDLAARAARCALALRPLLPGASLALATGRGEVAGALPVGDVIGRAVAQARGFSGDGIAVDEATAGLLGAAFDVDVDGRGRWLGGGRDEGEARTMLGRPVPCVGRERELAWLLGRYDACVATPASSAALLVAAAGVGKSRVRRELVRAVRDRGGSALVLLGRGDPVAAGAPFAIVASALRAEVGAAHGEALESRRARLRARVGRHVSADDAPRVAAFLGELTGTAFPDEALPALRAARSDPAAMADQVRLAWEDFLAAECAARPVVLVLEDLHWADAASVELVGAALRALRDGPLMVLALARPEVRDLFPGLWSGCGVAHAELAPLPRSAGEELVRGILGDRATDDLVDRVVGRAGGNAFVLEELVRAEAEGGGETPGSVLAMVQSRLEQLGPRERRALRAASVFGETFWAGGLRALVGDADADALPALVRREWVVACRASRVADDREYEFRHGLLREAAYATLVDDDRALAHRLAGAWLERVGAGDASVVAAHFDAGGERGRAAPWYLRAAEQALDAGDFAAVLAHAERGAACGASGEVGGGLAVTRAEALHWRGQYELAGEATLGALAGLGRESGWYWRALRLLGRLASMLGRPEWTELATHELLAALGGGAAGEPVLRAGLSITVNALFLGQNDAARSLGSALGTHLAGLRDPSPELLWHYERLLGEEACRRGDVGGSAEHDLASVDLARRVGDPRLLAVSLGNLGFRLCELGAWGEAEATLRGALSVALRAGLARLAPWARQNLAYALWGQGRLEEAQGLVESTRDAFAAQADRRMLAWSQCYAALIALAGDDLDEAEHLARASASGARSIPANRPAVLAVLARVLLTRGQAVEALANAREALAAHEALGGMQEFESLMRLVHAEALLAVGESAAARAALATAYLRLLARAAQVRDERYRATFLGGVPENARTVALAEAWGLSEG